jgi:hypothetical protein
LEEAPSSQSQRTTRIELAYSQNEADGVLVRGRRSIWYAKHLDGPLRRYVVRKIASVIITLETPDRKNELRRFHFCLHIGSSDASYVYLQQACQM